LPPKILVLSISDAKRRAAIESIIIEVVPAEITISVAEGMPGAAWRVTIERNGSEPRTIPIQGLVGEDVPRAFRAKLKDVLSWYLADR
jgi:hypothetical protein